MGALILTSELVYISLLSVQAALSWAAAHCQIWSATDDGAKLARAMIGSADGHGRILAAIEM